MVPNVPTERIRKVDPESEVPHTMGHTQERRDGAGLSLIGFGGTSVASVLVGEGW